MQGENSFIVRTLGCKANLADGDRIEAELLRLGWKKAQTEGAARLCIVNSCTVTDEADRQSRKLASRLGRENPDAVVVVTGCAAEVDPERIAGTPGVHYVIGNRTKLEIVEEILSKTSLPRPERGELLGKTSGYEEILSRHPIDRDWPSIDPYTDATDLGAQNAHTRTFLKIQEGCNAFCTYCIIPYGRGPSRSLRPLELVDAVKQACANGAREVVLTGTNIGDYGMDWSPQGTAELGELLQVLLEATPIERIRLSSLDPTEITDEIYALMEREPRLCAHFHVSLQSMSDRVLRLMKRRYGFAQVEDCLERIASLQPRSASSCFVGMDVITGFPGETDEDFEESFARFERLPWSRLHVFPYSERAGTPATRLPGSIPAQVRAARAKRLQKLSLNRVEKRAQATLEAHREIPLTGVLLETPYEDSHGRSWIAGTTSDYQRVVLSYDPQNQALKRNACVSVRPVRLELKAAQGEAILIAEPCRQI